MRQAGVERGAGWESDLSRPAGVSSSGGVASCRGRTERVRLTWRPEKSSGGEKKLSGPDEGGLLRAQ